MNARELALRTLIKIEEQGTYANLELKSALGSVEQKEKALATELIYGVLRYKLNLDYIRNQFSKLKENKISLPIKQIIRLGIYQIMYLEKVPDSAACNEAVKLTYKYGNKGAVGFVNGLLRNVSRSKEKLVYPDNLPNKLMFKYSYPEFLVNIWLDDYGEEKAELIMKGLNMPKKASIRPNLLRADICNIEEVFSSEGIDFAKNGNVYNVKNARIDKLKGYENGFFSIQDPASMKTVELLDPKKGDMVLDVCAAPGGKSCYMAEIMGDKGSIISCDLYPHRVELIKKNAKRLGINIINAMVNDATALNSDFINKFDKVLVDAPCSGFGVIAGKPDIKWRETDFDSLENLQYNILMNAINYLKNDGELVYSTCTIHSRENEKLVKKVLEQRCDVELASEYIQLMPCAENDGFFMCKLKKV